MDQQELQAALVRDFIRAKQVNPRVSKRAFARKLRISHGALIEIMNGRRKVSPALAGKICDHLTLSPEARKRIFEVGSGKREIIPSLTEDQFQLIAAWHHLALLSLIKLPKLSHKSSVFAARLNVPVTEIDRALERLLRLGLIRKHSGRWVRTKQSIQTSDEVASLSVQLYHRELLQLAGEKLASEPLERRDFTAITMKVNKEKIPAAKREIREFLDRMNQLLECGKEDEVYTMAVQLFPLTSNSNEGDQE